MTVQSSWNFQTLPDNPGFPSRFKVLKVLKTFYYMFIFIAWVTLRLCRTPYFYSPSTPSLPPPHHELQTTIEPVNYRNLFLFKPLIDFWEYAFCRKCSWEFVAWEIASETFVKLFYTFYVFSNLSILDLDRDIHYVNWF